MFRRNTIVVALLLWTAHGALADNFIWEWGGAQGGYEISQQARWVLITAAGTYKFAASDGPELGIIDHITVDPAGVTGSVYVHVAAPPLSEQHHGALHLKEINLSNAEDGHIVQVDIAGDLAELGDVIADQMSGPLSVGGDVLNDITIDSTISGPITITGVLAGDISCDSLADLTVTGGTSGLPNITVQARSPYSHTMDVEGSLGTVDVYGVSDVGVIQTSADLEHLVIRRDMSGHVGIAGDLLDATLYTYLAGTLDVGHDLLNMWVSSSITGSVCVGNDLYDCTIVSALAATGSVQVAGDLRGTLLNMLQPLAGSVAIDGNLIGAIETQYDDMSGELLVKGNMEVGGSIWIGMLGYANLTGTITIEGDQSGSIVEIGRMPNGSPCWCSGNLLIHGDMRGEISLGYFAWSALTGTITIGGDLLGQITVSGSLWDVSGDLSGGHIIINGSFGTDTTLAQILTGNFVGSTEFIAVDYDGWDSGDSWRNGVVYIAGYPEPIWGNTPEMHVWAITECKADMNNDRQVDFDDIDPFVQALGDPHAYALAFPGLGAVSAPWEVGGSRVFHGDLDCDEDLDFDDVDPFVTRVTEPCCIPECGDCPERGGAAMGPEALAAELALHIAPQRYDDLVLLVAQTAAAHPEPQRRAYWQAVYDALTP